VDQRRTGFVVLLRSTGLEILALGYVRGRDPPVCPFCINAARSRKSTNLAAQEGWKAARNIAFYELEFSGIPSFDRKQLQNRHKSPFKSLMQGLRRM
jgi:lipoate synthase